MGERKFVNPYHFISFPKTKAPGYTDEDRHTGMIRYTITTKTPLFIPNSSSDTAFKFEEAEKVRTEKQYHKSYDFFSYTELDEKENYEGKFYVPVVPGSEMRGVIRSVYETLTDSCMGVLNEDEYPIKEPQRHFSLHCFIEKKERQAKEWCCMMHIPLELEKKQKKQQQKKRNYLQDLKNVKMVLKFITENQRQMEKKDGRQLVNIA